MDDIRNLSMFGKMNSSIRDRRLNSSSNQNEKSFRKKNPKTNNSCINNNVNNCNKNDNTHANGNYNENNFINNENEKKVSDDNSNFKNELKSFLQENNNFDKINKNDLVELEKQKIIEINEEEDERSIDMNVGINSNIYYMNNNPDANNNLNTNSINTNYANREESIKNYKKSLSSTNKNPLEKFENLYLKGKSESNSNKDNNKYSKKSENVNYSVKTGDEILAKKENEIISTKNNNIKQEQTADFLSKDIKDLNIAYGLEHEENEENEELLDLNNFEENGEIEEIFNNFPDEDQVENKHHEAQEHFISPEDMNKMEKDELVKMILNSDLVKEKNVSNINNKNKNIDGSSYNHMLGNIKDYAHEDDIEHKIASKNEEKDKSKNLNKNSAAKNKFTFAPRKKNCDNNNHNNNEACDNKPNLENFADGKSKKINSTKEKDISEVKNKSKAKENSVNKYIPKLNTNNNKIKEAADEGAGNKSSSNLAKKNNFEDFNENKKNKNDYLNENVNSNSKAQHISSRKQNEESNTNSNNVLLDNKGIEQIDNKMDDSENKIHEGILLEIEKKEGELDSKQILEMLLYNKSELENEINQVFVCLFYLFFCCFF